MARQLDLDPEVEATLCSHLEVELSNHEGERINLETRWKEETFDFWAEPQTQNIELPVIGFASLIVPLTAIAVEAIHARDMGQMFGLKELVTVDVSDEFQDLRSTIDKYFNYELLENLKFRKSIEAPLLQITKHGTGIALSGYREVKSHKIVDRNGKEIRVPVYRKKGVCIEGVDIADFLMPFYASEIEDAPWVGHRFKVTEYTVKQMVASGELAPDAHSKLQAYYEGQIAREIGEQQKEELTDTVSVLPREVTLYRILIDYDVDQLSDTSSELSSVEVIFHRESRSIVSIVYHEDRDYEKGVYIPLEYRWYGYGIAKMNREFQEEVTAQHRQRLDNATIANMAMFKVKKTASWIKDDEPIFPGKKWFVEEMDDIEPMFIGDVKASAYNNENQVVVYAQQRSGVNDLTLGMPAVGTPGTASAELARVQESTRKFDYTYNNKKDFSNRLIRRASQLIIQNGATDRTIFRILPKGSELEIYLKQKDLLKHKLFFDIQLAGAKNNKILDRNTFTQLTGMVTQYWTQTLALADGLQDPMLKQDMTKAALNAADSIMLEVLRAFDIPNPEKLIFNFNAYKPQQSQIPQQIPGVPPAGIDPTGGAGGTEFNSIITPNVRVDNASISQNGGLPFPGLPLAG